MFGFLPHNLFTNHIGQSSSGLSPRIWGQVSGTLMEADGSKRLVLAGDDFMAIDSTDTYTKTNSEMHYTSAIDTGGTITGLLDEPGGVIALNVDASGTNEETWMYLGNSTTILGAISDTSGADYLTAFECRFKKTDAAMIFIGLGEEAMGVADAMVDDTGLMVDKDFIGFQSQAAAPQDIDFVYHRNGDTDDGGKVHITDGATAVDDTYMKVGFVYDPAAPSSERIKVYFNNVEHATKVTASDIASTTATDLFPDAEELNPTFGLKVVAAATGELAIDWWAFAQVIT